MREIECLEILREMDKCQIQRVYDELLVEMPWMRIVLNNQISRLELEERRLPAILGNSVRFCFTNHQDVIQSLLFIRTRLTHTEARI